MMDVLSNPYVQDSIKQISLKLKDTSRFMEVIWMWCKWTKLEELDVFIRANKKYDDSRAMEEIHKMKVGLRNIRHLKADIDVKII